MVDPVSSWRTIDELAGCVGGYCWQEHRFFAMTGRWASGEGDPAIRVCFSEMSSRHAGLAARWRDRLPVRAGVDVAALVVAPAGLAGALTALEQEPSPFLRLGGLVGVWAPRLLATYRAHLDRAWAVNEAPVIDVLRLIDLTGDREVQRGRDLLARGVPGVGPDEPDRAENVAEFCLNLQRLFEEPGDIIPAAWAS
jgi:hypothetical protein